jgi:hypothetical protein
MSGTAILRHDDFEEELYVDRVPGVDGTHVEGFRLTDDGNLQRLFIEFTDEGARRFAQITREADSVLYTRCGLEMAVASTKTFTAQVSLLFLVALKLAEIRGTLPPDELAALLGLVVVWPAALVRLATLVRLVVVGPAASTRLLARLWIPALIAGFAGLRLSGLPWLGRIVTRIGRLGPLRPAGLLRSAGVFRPSGLVAPVGRRKHDPLPARVVGDRRRRGPLLLLRRGRGPRGDHPDGARAQHHARTQHGRYGNASHRTPPRSRDLSGREAGGKIDPGWPRPRQWLRERAPMEEPAVGSS